MNKLTKLFLILSILFVGCTQRGCQSCNRAVQFTERKYEIFLYSGDSLIFHDTFKGIINQEEHSDGFFYFKGDTLIEIGGNYIIKSAE